MVKRLLLVVAIVLLLGVVALLSIDSKLYASYIEQRVVAAAGRQHVNLKFQDTDLSATTFEAAAVDAFFVPYLVSLHLEEVNVRPSISGLLPPVGGLVFSARGYSGEIKGWAGGALTSDARFLDLAARAVNLAEHQQLRALGLESGVVDLMIETLRLPQVDGRLSFSLKNGNKPQATTIPIPHQLFRSLTIPPLTGIELAAEISCESGTCSISTLSGRSSFATFDAHGSFGVDLPRGLHGFEIDATVKLTEAGHADVGPFLPMISRGRLDGHAREFKARIAGTPRSPVLELSKL